MYRTIDSRVSVCSIEDCQRAVHTSRRTRRTDGTLLDARLQIARRMSATIATNYDVSVDQTTNNDGNSRLWFACFALDMIDFLPLSPPLLISACTIALSCRQYKSIANAHCYYYYYYVAFCRMTSSCLYCTDCIHGSDWHIIRAHRILSQLELMIP